MSKQVVAEVIALIEMGMIAPEDIVKCLRKANSEPEQALAAPVQEPLEYWNAVEGWVKIDEVREHFDSVGCGTIYKTAGDGRVPLTAVQRQWVGLTIEEIASCCRESTTTQLSFYNAIEAKLKEKNT